LSADTRREATRKIAARRMSRAQNQIQRKVIRWALIVGAALVIVGVNVNSLREHLFSTGPVVPGQASREKSATIAEKWQFTQLGPVSAALALGDDGTVYAASEDGFLYAIDASGNLRWKFNAGPMQAAPVLGADDTIYVTNEAQSIFAVNHDGTQQWVAGGGPYADKRTGSFAAAIDQAYLYAPWRGLLRAVRLTYGTFTWPAGYGYQNGGSVIKLANGLIVYTGAGRLDAVDSTGKIQWQYPEMNPPLTVDMLTKNGGHIPIGTFWLDSPMAVGDDGTLYFCAVDSRLIALTSDGHFTWEFKTKTHSVNHAAPVIAADGTIYFASGDGSVYALFPNERLKWAFAAGGGAIAATPVLAQDGTIYVVNDAGLFAVSAQGKLLAHAAVGGSVDSSPTIAPDGTVYVAARAGKIVAFSGTHGGLLNGAWPKFQAGPANSGRARGF
jgi:outer membrane protein assembly factor BamB